MQGKLLIPSSYLSLVGSSDETIMILSTQDCTQSVYILTHSASFFYLALCHHFHCPQVGEGIMPSVLSEKEVHSDTIFTHPPSAAVCDL